MQKVFAFQINLCATELFRKPLCVEQRCRTSGVLFEQVVQPLLELAVLLRLFVLTLQLFECGHECFRNVASAIDAKTSRYRGGFLRGCDPCPSCNACCCHK